MTVRADRVKVGDSIRLDRSPSKAQVLEIRLSQSPGRTFYVRLGDGEVRGLHYFDDEWVRLWKDTR